MDQTPHSSISRESLAWTVCLQSVWEKSMGLNPRPEHPGKGWSSRRTQKPVLEAVRLNPEIRQGLKGFKWLKVLTTAQVFPAHLSCTSFSPLPHLSCTIWYFPPNFCVIWILNPHWVLRKPLEKHRKKINLHSKDIWVGSHLKGVSFNAVLVCFQKSQVCNTKTLPVRKFSEWTT